MNSRLEPVRRPRLRWCAILLLAVLAASSVSTRADSPSASSHEIHIYPQAETVPLRLEGWLVPVGDSYQITVTSEPSFGQLDGESYLPGQDFWQARVDRLTLSITNLSTVGQETSLHTFLFSPLEVATPTLRSFNDFEPNKTWPGDWTVVGSSSQVGPSAVRPIDDLQSLAAGISGSQTAWASLDILGGGSIGGGATGYGGSGGTVVEGPPIEDPGSTVIAALGGIELELEFYDPPGPGGGHYRVRASAPAAHCSVCRTPWQQIDPGRRIGFTLWAGNKVTDAHHNPYMGPWSVLLKLEPEGLPSTVEWIDGDFDAANLGLNPGQLRLGILQPPSGMQGLRIVHDNWATWTEEYLFEERGHLAEIFHHGASSWQQQGIPGSWVANAGGSTWSWAIDVDQLRASSTIEDAILVEPSPGDPVPGNSLLDGRDTAATALLRLDLEDLTLEDGESIQLIRGSSSENIDGGLFLSLQLIREDDQYWLVARTRDDDGSIQKTPWSALSHTQHDLALQWRAGSADGADDGVLRFWIDGRMAGERLDLDNDTWTIEALAFGAHRSVLGTSSTPRGKLLLSDLASFPGQ